MGVINDEGLAKLERSLNKCFDIRRVANVTIIISIAGGGGINSGWSIAVGVIANHSVRIMQGEIGWVIDNQETPSGRD